MPQLAPLNWLVSFFLIITFALSLASIFWWRQNLVFPTLQNTRPTTAPNKTWPW
uniref:ATP synthase F0 subunit 8 n=1 Tax=Cirriformia cf. tentaculata HK-2018 TaxID=2100094 RepID=A0A343UWG1_9ANNE|nr:ATP synthase F0 subunit 8 [Cirriformia cf. tentaculata HK-2018]AVI26189.1 ATP synthase F0 subunit 8 [Cirriformia cf. tentaculata HK-2018]